MKIFNKKIVFKKNLKTDILLLDENYSNLKFKNKKIYVLDFNEINLFYILRVLFSFKFFKTNYKKIYWLYYFRDLDPKIAIGIDINLRIFSFKEMFPEKITIAYQLGHYWNIHSDRSLELFRSKKSDYTLVFSNWEIQNIFKNLETRFLITGSVKNNAIKKKKKKKIYDIMFISEFRKLDPITINKIKNGYYSYTFENRSRQMRFVDTCIIYVLKIINKIQKDQNLKVSVGLTSNRNDKINKISRKDELKFFSEYLENCKTEKLNSFNLAEKSKLIICLSSNLGPELLSRGYRVLFLNLDLVSNEWHFLKSLNGPFWYKGTDKNVIIKKINTLINYTDKEWKKILNKSGLKMVFDKGNKKLNKIVKKTFLKN